MKNFVLILVVLVFAGVAHAQQYRWVDKSGKVQYGDVPPAGVKATPMKAPAGPPTAPPAAASKDAAKDDKKGPPLSPEEAFRKRQEDQKKAAEKASKSQQETESAKRACDSARAQLRDLEGGIRIARTNDKGEREFIDDSQRAKEIDNARKSVAESCK
jgi:hypothetical protein